MSTWLVVTFVSLATGLVLQPLLIPWLRRRGVMDVPNARSSHVVATPRGGGLAVLAALGMGVLVAQVGWQAWAVFAGSLLLGAIGLVDDFRGVDPKARLGALLLIGAAAGFWLDSPLGVNSAVPLMAVWTAAYVNAFNFMDGIDGISALSGVVAGAAFVAMGFGYGAPTLIGLGAALLGSCLSFLPFNLPQARVFLGDVGSYGMGFVIAAGAWLSWASGVPLLLAGSPTFIYLADTGWTLLRRARAGAPLLRAHRDHAYQRLAASGQSHVRVSFTVASTSAGIVFLSWLGAGFGIAGTALATSAIAAILAAHLSAPSRLTTTAV